MYTKEEIKKYCSQIFVPGRLSTLKEIPPEFVRTFFDTYDEIKGIEHLEPSLVNELIMMGYVTSKHFIDIVKTANFENL